MSVGCNTDLSLCVGVYSCVTVCDIVLLSVVLCHCMRCCIIVINVVIVALSVMLCHCL